MSKTYLSLCISLTLFLCVHFLSFSQKLPEANEHFKIGMAGYTYHKFDLDRTLDDLATNQVKYLCIKDFHLPFNSSEQEIAAFHQKLAEKGVTGYAVGPIYMRSKADVDNAFDYAKRVGVKLIVGVPNHELLPYINEKVKAYDFKYAIHMHGPDIALYPDADDIWSHIKDLDPRMGMCLDIGHTARNGKDPVADLEKYNDRIFDMHIKDVTAASKEGKSIEIGRGILDIPALVQMLRKTGYSGVCSLEHERNFDNPFSGIAESIGYFRGVIVATKQ
ncbi:sugar phosphate isomerase/epimerase family protein [Cecembia calidifontis]|jgi:sugar phosphate isomerase/epimerase|uniref:Sugar phosphate isomerase/epimerase n=1 Tax=Cecembia calidifontis TaxID=1187080 RepID=A0A4Q7PFZ7_9BACT|nr:sugar phosphate isomerase/epimerase family protein [Cecembia calidifontis]RZS98630.1 sugar phosphate isomerase/epimerase [Cecembia calidifontis]